MKPACDLECATCRYQIDPTHCADLVSGEQGPTTDEIEIARLQSELSSALAKLELVDDHRRGDSELISRLKLEVAQFRGELSEARADISVLRDDRDRIRTVSAEALALRDRLSTIVDEAFGLQEVLGVDALLSRLEHLLNERTLQSSAVRRELDEWKEWADYHSSWALIDAERPPDAELRARIGEMCDVVTGEEWAQMHGERAKLLAELDEERGQKKSDLLQELAALTVALRDLVAATDKLNPTRLDFTIVHARPGGDFVAALRLPSFVGRARWWARELRAALEGQS